MVLLTLSLSATFDSHEQMDNRIILVDEGVEGDRWLFVLATHADQSLVARRQLPHFLDVSLDVAHGRLGQVIALEDQLLAGHLNYLDFLHLIIGNE